MSGAPERIVARKGCYPSYTTDEWSDGEWYTPEVGMDGDETEYVRADLLEASQKRVLELEARVKAALDACDCADDLVSQQEPVSAASVTIWVRRGLTTQEDKTDG